MSPVVIVGFTALDAALIAQGIYGYRDYRRASKPSRAVKRSEGPTPK